MCYRVSRVSSRKELNDFLNLPKSIYRNDKNWIAPFKSEVKRILNSSKNPYFKNASLQLFNCYMGDKIVSRTAVIINDEYEKKFGIKNAYFGFFESFDDLSAVRLLFRDAESYCEQNSISNLEGPFNPNHYSEVGIQLDNFNSLPTFFEAYNPHYYNKLLLSAGYSVSKIIHTRINKNTREYISKQFGDNREIDSGDYKVRSFDFKNIEGDLENLRQVFNDAFANNWSFLPVSKDEYLFSSKYMRLVTPPNLIRFVEYRSDVIAAVHFALNINPLLKESKGKFNPIKYYNLLKERKNINEVVLFAVGIKSSYKRTKVYPILFNEILNIALNYKILLTTWMDEKNVLSIRSAERLGLLPKKEFAVYKKKLRGI